MRYTCLLLCILLAGCEYAGRLQPFTSDGCSVIPDGPPADPERWRACCVTHDRAYWLGGSYAQRRIADDALESCISKIDDPLVGAVIRAGVRTGGSPFWITNYRWGYGWPYTRGYRPLTSAERALAESLDRGAQ